MTGGLTAKTEDFRFAEEYIGMEVIEKAGTPIAYDDGETLVTPYDDCLLMMPSYKQGVGMRKLRLCRRIG